MKKPIFEVHLESWAHALHICNRGHDSDSFWLKDLLKKHNIKATWYVLRDYRDEHPEYCKRLLEGEIVRSHGIHHYYDEKAERSPYFNQEGQPGWCGGFFFRILPLWLIRAEIKRTGIFYIHPHDLDRSHPKLKNPFMNWKRHVGLKGARKKLEALLASIDKWD